MFKIIAYFKKLLNRSDDRKVLGSAYAVTTGTYVGEVFIYIREDDTNIHFLSIPKMLNREVPIEKFKYATDNNVIEFIEKIPRNERVICNSQYEANEKA
tara:strand:+ start:719 stop:1015 length:297 start_codon:yes stop_codon:yes gene_type:complete